MLCSAVDVCPPIVLKDPLLGFLEFFWRKGPGACLGLGGTCGGIHEGQGAAATYVHTNISFDVDDLVQVLLCSVKQGANALVPCMRGKHLCARESGCVCE